MAETSTAVPARSPGTQRFVVLEHAWQGVHWDFMLEQAGVLRTWRLPEPPRHGVTMVAVALPDHRIAYLDYEGPVSGGRGEVRRLDRGTYTGEVGPERVVVELRGERLRGTAYLTKRGDSDWEFRFSAASDASCDPSEAEGRSARTADR